MTGSEPADRDHEADAELAAHRAHVEAVRASRDAGLRDPEGWLSLVGLHWLHPGENRFGSDPACEVPLDAADGAAIPSTAGWLTVEPGVVTVHGVTLDAGLTLDGGPVPDHLLLVDDLGGEPTILALGSLRFHVVRRGDRTGIRVRDRSAPALAAFAGMEYYPVDPAWRVVGRLTEALPGQTIPVPDVLGDVNEEPSPGVVELELGGMRHRLRALEADPGHLFLVFGDATNGSETYGGGRFLVTGPVTPDGAVEVDFNLAYNPPCVFSPYATCALPPAGNRLPVRVEAGERGYGTTAHEPSGPGNRRLP